MLLKVSLYAVISAIIVTSLAHPLTDDECLKEELIVDQCHPCKGTTITGRLFRPLPRATAAEVTTKLCYVSEYVKNMSQIFQNATGTVFLHTGTDSLIPTSIQNIFEGNGDELTFDQKTYTKITAITAALKMASDLNMVSLQSTYDNYETKANDLLCSLKKKNATILNLSTTVCKLYALYPNVSTVTEKLSFIRQALEKTKNVIIGLTTEWENVTNTRCHL